MPIIFLFIYPMKIINQAKNIREQFGTPVYVYDETALKKNAQAALNFPHPFGLNVRYAMKACSNAAILQIFDQAGLHIDASSGYEVERAQRAGIAMDKISLSAQEFPENFAVLYNKGITFNACSLHQIKRFGELFPGRQLGLRFNPGLGSGHTNKTNVGGPYSSFGIWYEFMDEVKALLAKYNLKVFRIHTHIGSGSDPKVWQQVAHKSLAMVEHFHEVKILNLGGGYKVARMPEEKSTDFQIIGKGVYNALKTFATKTGRQLQLEIEPGTFLVANACSLLTTVHDIVSTGKDGFSFLKLDTGMTDILRPTLYGAQHPIIICKKTNERAEYIVTGHCCESGDLLTPTPGDPESPQPRLLSKAAIGDLCVIKGAGAYCSSLNTKNYNSFPESPEVLITEKNELQLIRKRQTIEQMIQNELTTK
jgi:diaminopimelate decarboxylase